MKRLLFFAIFLLALLPGRALAQANVAIWCPVSGTPLLWVPCGNTTTTTADGTATAVAVNSWGYQQ